MKRFALLSFSSVLFFTHVSTSEARTMAQVQQAGFLRVGMPGDLYPFNLEAVGH
ncbi:MULTISPECIES: hypothetical protein [Deinococcus]|uniref:hypothetical protein n=1 Tax=Deinococcus TaxID=1298 RepID=UPI001314208A|nr:MULTISPECIES: hypothetical protein [Deinococcus]